MKTTKNLIIAAVILPLVLSTGSALALGDKGKPHKDDHGRCGIGLDRNIMQELELTDAQKEQFKALRETHKEARKNKSKGNAEQHKTERLAHREKINNLLLAEKFDPAKATKLAQEIAQKEVNRQVSSLKNQHQMMSVLTAKQKTKFIEIQKEHSKECAEKMPKHHKK